jgi:hypothetical protein
MMEISDKRSLKVRRRNQLEDGGKMGRGGRPVEFYSVA